MFRTMCFLNMHVYYYMYYLILAVVVINFTIGKVRDYFYFFL